MPAQAGNQNQGRYLHELVSRLRGNDETRVAGMTKLVCGE
jgi:hypothetical protein